MFTFMKKNHGKEMLSCKSFTIDWLLWQSLMRKK